MTTKIKEIAINHAQDLPSNLQNTPIQDLFEFHNNSKESAQDYTAAKMAIVMCMDNRKKLNIPNNFAYIVRSPGARIKGNEFGLSFAIGAAKVQHIAMIAHTDCGMVNLPKKKEATLEGFQELLGWSKENSEQYFETNAKEFFIEDGSEFVVKEAKRLASEFPNTTVVPMLYKVEDHKLYLLEE
jgi:carbonic anhydrase